MCRGKKYKLLYQVILIHIQVTRQQYSKVVKETIVVQNSKTIRAVSILMYES
jgi:hypothetical protein